MTIQTKPAAGNAPATNAPIETTPLFWDCQCETNYIHPKTKFRCWRCGTDAADMPDARINEIEWHLNHPHRNLPFEDGDLVILFAVGTDAEGKPFDTVAMPAQVKTANRLYAFIEDCLYLQSDGYDNNRRYRIAPATAENIKRAEPIYFFGNGDTK